MDPLETPAARLWTPYAPVPPALSDLSVPPVMFSRSLSGGGQDKAGARLSPERLSPERLSPPSGRAPSCALISPAGRYSQVTAAMAMAGDPSSLPMLGGERSGGGGHSGSGDGGGSGGGGSRGSGCSFSQEHARRVLAPLLLTPASIAHPSIYHGMDIPARRAKGTSWVRQATLRTMQADEARRAAAVAAAAPGAANHHRHGGVGGAGGGDVGGGGGGGGVAGSVQTGARVFDGGSGGMLRPGSLKRPPAPSSPALSSPPPSSPPYPDDSRGHGHRSPQALLPPRVTAGQTLQQLSRLRARDAQVKKRRIVSAPIPGAVLRSMDARLVPVRVPKVKSALRKRDQWVAAAEQCNAGSGNFSVVGSNNNLPPLVQRLAAQQAAYAAAAAAATAAAATASDNAEVEAILAATAPLPLLRKAPGHIPDLPLFGASLPAAALLSLVHTR